MVLTKQAAIQLQAILHPQVEQALNLLLEELTHQTQQALVEEISEVEIRRCQGKLVLLRDLKQLRSKIEDTIRNDKFGSFAPSNST